MLDFWSIIQQANTKSEIGKECVNRSHGMSVKPTGRTPMVLKHLG